MINVVLRSIENLTCLIGEGVVSRGGVRYVDFLLITEVIVMSLVIVVDTQLMSPTHHFSNSWGLWRLMKA